MGVLPFKEEEHSINLLVVGKLHFLQLSRNEARLPNKPRACTEGGACKFGHGALRDAGAHTKRLHGWPVTFKHENYWLLHVHTCISKIVHA
jgi:hypothetical protein